MGCEWVYNGIAVSHFGYIYISHVVVSWDIYKPILGYTISIHIMGYIMGIYIYIQYGCIMLYLHMECVCNGNFDKGDDQVFFGG